MDALFWLEDSIVGMMVSSTMWGYPIILSVHAVGMALTVGMAFVFAVRVAGFASSIPVSAMTPFRVVYVSGLALSLFSGSALFCGGASDLFFNWGFRLKIASLLFSVAVTGRLVQSCVAQSRWSRRAQKCLASIVAASWFSTLIWGRLIGYMA